jgi:AraC-like DNA-binding protein
MEELIEVLRRPGCPGVEMIRAEHSPRTWGHLNNVFAFGSMWDWQGKLRYRRRNHTLSRGDACLFDPGELFHAVPENGHSGSFRVFEIAPDTFEALCRAEGVRVPLHFIRTIGRAAPQLTASLDALHAALQTDAEPLEYQSHLALVIHAAVTTGLEPGPRASTRPLTQGLCERLREILHSTEATQINLYEFARQAEVSQFQLLRAFKRRYGSPPHAYGLHVRVDRARHLLRRGFTVAEAAAAADFVDQSHFYRHFRRIWGLTPSQYALGSARPATRRH